MNTFMPTPVGTFDFSAAGEPATATLRDDGTWSVAGGPDVPPWLAGFYRGYLNALYGPRADRPSYLGSRARVCFCSAYESLAGSNGLLAPDATPKGQVN